MELCEEVGRFKEVSKRWEMNKTDLILTFFAIDEEMKCWFHAAGDMYKCVQNFTAQNGLLLSVRDVLVTGKEQMRVLNIALAATRYYRLCEPNNYCQ